MDMIQLTEILSHCCFCILYVTEDEAQNFASQQEDALNDLAKWPFTDLLNNKFGSDLSMNDLCQRSRKFVSCDLGNMGFRSLAKSITNYCTK